MELEHKLRLEKAELIMKLRKLKMFKLSDEWKKLDTHEACLLDVQERIMEAYVEILTDRICLLKQKEWQSLNDKSNIKSIKITIEGNED